MLRILDKRTVLKDGVTVYDLYNVAFKIHTTLLEPLLGGFKMVMRSFVKQFRY